MKKTFILGTLYLSLIINLILGIAIYITNFNKPQNQEDGRQFKYLSPRIFAENQNDILINFVPLRETLQNYESENSGKIGIYFEYLPSGVSIGINEKENFFLASLLKVPLAMQVFKQIELGKMMKKDVLTVTKKDIDPGYGTFWEKGAGTKITVQDALKLSLQYSDNTATNVLYNNIPTGALSEVFDYLDIPQDVDSSSPIVTAKNYSSILRSLYLSSFLSPQGSEELLELLTGSIHSDKIRAPIPTNIKVAHKIGVHKTDNPKDAAYSDCGIVYFPKRPYILCIMTKGSEESAREYMQSISSIVYQYVSSVNKTATK